MIVEYCLDINAPIEDVYRVSQDYAVRYRWDPFSERIEMLDGASEVKAGAQVRVLAKSGLAMQVRFVQVQPPETAAIVMTEGPVFLKMFAGSWTFRDRGNSSTTARFRYSLKMKPWALPLVSERLAALYFRKKIEQRLQGLKQYCEAEKGVGNH